MITTEARRLVRLHNGMPADMSGVIWSVDLRTGRFLQPIATYAASQPPLEERKMRKVAYLRVGHGKLTQVEAQRFLDEYGEGF